MAADGEGGMGGLADAAADAASVLVERRGRIGRITLNRPKALNALTLDMIRLIAAALDEWRDDPAVHAVVLDANGGRAFCAGGDIRVIRDAAAAGDEAGVRRFFVEEYALILAIADYPKPYVSLIDGLCMGGGVGLSVHGSARVATEAAQFAMPETIIGLFPDVGATFALPRLRGCHGMRLALTGARVGGADATWLGVATHFVSRERIGRLTDEMAENGIAVLAEAAEPPPPGPLAGQDVSPFGLDSVPAVLAALEEAGTEWARAALDQIRAASPSAVLWTFEIVRQGARRTLAQCLAAELELAVKAARGPEFHEGVRAMVVDKDRAPAWSPGRIEDVDPARIAAMLA